MDKQEEAVLFPTVGAAEGQLPYNYYEPIIPYEEPQCNTPDIKFFSEIEAASVNWLWYPYIPFGKVTIIQGDPGEGKTTLALNIATILSRGERLPTELDYAYTYDCITSIYQTAEDGLFFSVWENSSLGSALTILTLARFVRIWDIPLRKHRPKWNKQNFWYCPKSVEGRRISTKKENINKRTDNSFMNFLNFRKANSFSCKTLYSCP